MNKLKSWIKELSNIVVFTGAGISTESGIPDFRSPGSIWTKMAPIMFQDFMSSEESQIESWRRKFAIDQDMKIAKPNIGHKVTWYSYWVLTNESTLMSANWIKIS